MGAESNSFGFKILSARTLNVLRTSLTLVSEVHAATSPNLYNDVILPSVLT